MVSLITKNQTKTEKLKIKIKNKKEKGKKKKNKVRKEGNFIAGSHMGYGGDGWPNGFWLRGLSVVHGSVSKDSVWMSS